MPTASVVVDDVGGYAGPARCYRVEPAVEFGGTTYEFVTVVVTPPYTHQSAEVKLFPAREDGSCATPQLHRRIGSLTLREDYTPGDTVYEDGVRWLALQLLGGYQPADTPEDAEGQ